jgi:predicted DNA binding protein
MKLRKAKIGVRHKGCWGSLCTVDYPDISMKEMGPINVRKVSSGVRLSATWDVRFKNREDFHDFLKSLEKYEMIKFKKVIEENEDSALLKTEWVNKRSSYEIMLRNNCLYMSNVIQQNGYEIYEIITEDPQKIVRLIENLDDIGEVKLFEIGKVQPKSHMFSLTEKQSKALQIAVSHRFYSWPRVISLDEIAAAAGLKRRTFQENLRKAEAKVFPHLINHFFDREGI